MLVDSTCPRRRGIRCYGWLPSTFRFVACHSFPTPPTPHPIGDSAIFLRAIGSQIRDQLALPWVPPLLRTPKLQRLQVGSPPPVLLDLCPPCLLCPQALAQVVAPHPSLVPQSRGRLCSLHRAQPSGSHSTPAHWFCLS